MAKAPPARLLEGCPEMQGMTKQQACVSDLHTPDLGPRPRISFETSGRGAFQAARLWRHIILDPAPVHEVQGRQRRGGRWQKGGVKRDLRRGGVQFKFKSPPDGGTRRGDAVELPLTVKGKWKNVFEEEPTGARSAFAPHRPKRSSKTSSW